MKPGRVVDGTATLATAALQCSHSFYHGLGPGVLSQGAPASLQPHALGIVSAIASPPTAGAGGDHIKTAVRYSAVIRTGSRRRTAGLMAGQAPGV